MPTQGSKKNWDAIDSDLKKKEEEEKPEGEEALNKLFRDIYGKVSSANEHTRLLRHRERHVVSTSR